GPEGRGRGRVPHAQQQAGREGAHHLLRACRRSADGEDRDVGHTRVATPQKPTAQPWAFTQKTAEHTKPQPDTNLEQRDISRYFPTTFGGFAGESFLMDYAAITEAAKKYEPDMVTFLRDIVAIEGYSGTEKNVIERIRAEVEKLGAADRVWVDGLG